MERIFAAWSLAAWLALYMAVVNAAESKVVELHSSVAAGDEHVSRLRDIPAGARLSIEVRLDGEARVSLLDRFNAGRPPDQREPVTSALGSGIVQLQATISKGGHHFLVIDNRKGDATRNFHVRIVGHPLPNTKPPASDSGSVEASSLEAGLNQFIVQLRSYFEFDELQIQLARCVNSHAYSQGNRVVICLEISALLQALDDREKANDLLTFVLMHEISHHWLHQWHYPFYSNEDIADEMATALLVLFGQGERLRAPVELFSKISPEREFELKRDRDDRHSLSIQRARNILRWLGDPQELLRRWQKILVPHMQTDVLRAMQRSDKSWINHPLVDNELRQRENTGSEKNTR